MSMPMPSRMKFASAIGGLGGAGVFGGFGGGGAMSFGAQKL